MEQALNPGLAMGPRPLWAAAAAWLRGLGRRPAEMPLRVEARVSLGPKQSLVLVNCRGRRVLLAVSGAGIAPVMEMARERAGTRKGGAR